MFRHKLLPSRHELRSRCVSDSRLPQAWLHDRMPVLLTSQEVGPGHVEGGGEKMGARREVCAHSRAGCGMEGAEEGSRGTWGQGGLAERNVGKAGDGVAREARAGPARGT